MDQILFICAGELTVEMENAEIEFIFFKNKRKFDQCQKIIVQFDIIELTDDSKIGGKSWRELKDTVMDAGL